VTGAQPGQPIEENPGEPDVRRVLDGASILTKRRGPGEPFEELVFTPCLPFHLMDGATAEDGDQQVREHGRS
jgi:hypothetical protein